MRQRWLVAVGLVAGAAGVVWPRHAEATDLVATVSWTAPGNQRGSLLFQGTGDGGILRGNAFAGNDRLIVNGTIGDDGTVSGTLAATNGTIVGNFAAYVDADQQLQGAYVIFNTIGGWTAPADKLPSGATADCPPDPPGCGEAHQPGP